VGRSTTAARKVAESGPASSRSVALKKATPAKAAATKAEPRGSAATDRTKAPAAKVAPASTTSTPTKKTTPVTKASPAAPAPANPVPAKKASPAARTSASKLVVLEAEDPWTKDELNDVRNQLRADVKRLNAELDDVAGDLADLMRDAGESAGSDQADVGSATFERDQEMTIVNNARDMLEQSEHALARIADGTYGVCEMCGNPIGKNRLMVFPRATMCLTCKQREERR
jgi:RNA polymerase-binding transcription factor